MSGGRLGALVALLVLLVGGTARAEDDSWRVELDRQAEQDMRRWGVAAGIAGGAELVGVVALPFRGPGAPDFLVANVASFNVTGVGLLTAGLVRLNLSLSPDRHIFWKRMVIGSVVLISAAAAWTYPAVVLAYQFSILVGPGPIMLLAATPCMLLVAGLTMAAYARGSARPRGEADRLRPQLVSAGPTGLVVRF